MEENVLSGIMRLLALLRNKEVYIFMKRFLIIILIIGILAIGFGVVMQYVFDLFTLPVACVVSAGVGCVVSSTLNLLLYKYLYE